MEMTPWILLTVLVLIALAAPGEDPPPPRPVPTPWGDLVALIRLARRIPTTR